VFDNGQEFNMPTFYQDHGIIHQITCVDVCIDKEKGSRFYLAKGQMSQMDLPVEVTEGSILLRRWILEMWPKHKC
jgi:hypothetical protein